MQGSCAHRGDCSLQHPNCLGARHLCTEPSGGSIGIHGHVTKRILLQKTVDYHVAIRFSEFVHMACDHLDVAVLTSMSGARVRLCRVDVVGTLHHPLGLLVSYHAEFVVREDDLIGSEWPLPDVSCQKIG